MATRFRYAVAVAVAALLPGCGADVRTVLAASTTDGVRVEVTSAAPPRSGRPSVLSVRVANGSGRPIYVPDGSCDGQTYARLTLALPAGPAATDPVSRLRREALEFDPGATSLPVTGRGECGVEDVERVVELAPGAEISERFEWTGYLAAGAAAGDGGHMSIRPSGLAAIEAGIAYSDTPVAEVHRLPKVALATGRVALDGGEPFVGPADALDTALADPRVRSWIGIRCASDCHATLGAGRRTWHLQLLVEGKGGALLLAEVDVRTGELLRVA